MATVVVEIGLGLDTIPTPTHMGYTFDGWYTKPDGGDLITTSTVFTESITVYAHWRKEVLFEVPVIITTTLPNGTISKNYTSTLSATVTKPITWSLTSGNLPEGLRLSDDGKITGMPVCVGTSVFTVQASNDAGNVVKTLRIPLRNLIRLGLFTRQTSFA